MPKSLKPRQVQPPGKHARFQETTIAFQLKENKRFVKESSIPWMPPSPTSLPASPKRYVHGLVDPVFTLLFCGNSTVSVLVNRMGWACLSDYRGKWHSAAYNWIFVFFFLTQTKVASFTQCGEKKIALCFSWIISEYHLEVTGQNCTRQSTDSVHSMQQNGHSLAMLVLWLNFYIYLINLLLHYLCLSVLP